LNIATHLECCGVFYALVMFMEAQTKANNKRNSLHKFINDIKQHKDIEVFQGVARDLHSYV